MVYVALMYGGFTNNIYENENIKDLYHYDGIWNNIKIYDFNDVKNIPLSKYGNTAIFDTEMKSIISNGGTSSFLGELRSKFNMLNIDYDYKLDDLNLTRYVLENIPRANKRDVFNGMCLRRNTKYINEILTDTNFTNTIKDIFEDINNNPNGTDRINLARMSTLGLINLKDEIKNDIIKYIDDTIPSVGSDDIIDYIDDFVSDKAKDYLLVRKEILTIFNDYDCNKNCNIERILSTGGKIKCYACYKESYKSLIKDHIVYISSQTKDPGYLNDLLQKFYSSFNDDFMLKLILDEIIPDYITTSKLEHLRGNIYVFNNVWYNAAIKFANAHNIDTKLSKYKAITKKGCILINLGIYSKQLILNYINSYRNLEELNKDKDLIIDIIMYMLDYGSNDISKMREFLHADLFEFNLKEINDIVITGFLNVINTYRDSSIKKLIYELSEILLYSNISGSKLWNAKEDKNTILNYIISLTNNRMSKVKNALGELVLC